MSAEYKYNNNNDESESINRSSLCQHEIKSRMLKLNNNNNIFKYYFSLILLLFDFFPRCNENSVHKKLATRRKSLFFMHFKCAPHKKCPPYNTATFLHPPTHFINNMQAKKRKKSLVFVHNCIIAMHYVRKFMSFCV